MVMCDSGDILHAKVDNIFGDIKIIKIYINYILVLIMDIFYKHIKQLKVVFNRLCGVGLNANASKCSFWLKEIPYLCYVITWYSIKTYPNKVNGFLDIRRPTTSTELQMLICMVQYYRYIWPRISYMLDPLTEAASFPKGRKILCNYVLEESFKEPNHMVYIETFLNYPDCVIHFTLHTDDYDKNVGAFISHNSKPIAFFQVY